MNIKDQKTETELKHEQLLVDKIKYYEDKEKEIEDKNFLYDYLNKKNINELDDDELELKKKMDDKKIKEQYKTKGEDKDNSMKL